jgi:hypothetical protein
MVVLMGKLWVELMVCNLAANSDVLMAYYWVALLAPQWAVQQVDKKVNTKAQLLAVNWAYLMVVLMVERMELNLGAHSDGSKVVTTAMH